MPRGPLNGCGALSLVSGRGQAPADLDLGKGLHRCEGFCIQLLNPLLDSEEAILQKRKLESRHWLDGAAVSCLPYQLWAPFRMSANPDILWLALVVLTSLGWVQVPPKHWSHKP